MNPFIKKCLSRLTSKKKPQHSIQSARKHLAIARSFLEKAEVPPSLEQQRSQVLKELADLEINLRVLEGASIDTSINSKEAEEWTRATLKRVSEYLEKVRVEMLTLQNQMEQPVPSVN